MDEAPSLDPNDVLTFTSFLLSNPDLVEQYEVLHGMIREKTMLLQCNLPLSSCQFTAISNYLLSNNLMVSVEQFVKYPAA
jgi:hypothetical protein